MKTPKITAYLKPTCGWREGVRAILGKSLPYEDRDIINNPFNYTEMLEKERAPSPMRRPTGLATRTINPTQVLWQNFSR